MKYKIRVEYEDTPIRSLVVQCPWCGNWFNVDDIVTRNCPRWEYELYRAEYCCPKCENVFGYSEECNEPEETPIPAEGIYHGVLQKKVVWE